MPICGIGLTSMGHGVRKKTEQVRRLKEYMNIGRIAVGVDQAGYRQAVGIRKGIKEDHESWLGFIREMKKRRLKVAELFISDYCLGLVRGLEETFPEALWQGCVFHFYRNVCSLVPA